MAINFQIGVAYSFSVYPAALIGNNFVGVTVMAVMDYQSANREIDTQACHVAYYPSLPSGTPNKPSGYNYVKIKTTAGNTTILGLAWINEDTITVVTSRTITAVIGDVSAADLVRIKNALVQNGFNSVQLSIS